MRKILQNSLFRVVLLIIGGFILFSSSKTTNSFSWFALRTQKKNVVIQNNIYMPKETMTDILMDIISTHNKIAVGLPYSFANSDAKGLQGNSINSFLVGSQRLLYTDVISYLDNASNKETALESYTSQIQYYQGIGSTYIMQLQNTIQEQNALLDVCSSQKTQADTMFYQGLYNGDEVDMKQGLADSQTHGICQTKARIMINAHKAMLLRVQNIQTTMTNLSSILSQNHDTIIHNYQLFKDSYLEKLINVRNQLRAHTPGSTHN